MSEAVAPGIAPGFFVDADDRCDTAAGAGAADACSLAGRAGADGFDFIASADDGATVDFVSAAAVADSWIDPIAQDQFDQPFGASGILGFPFWGPKFLEGPPDQVFPKLIFPGPFDADHQRLQSVFGHGPGDIVPGEGWLPASYSLFVAGDAGGKLC